MLIDGKQIFDVVPRLQKHRQDTVGLRPRLGGYALCHLFLQHAAAARDAVAPVEHLKEYLRRDIVWIIAYHTEVAFKHRAEVELQEVLADDAPVKLRKVVLQILDRLTVEFHYSHIMSAFEQELRKHAHPRSHFEHRHSSIIVERGSYTVCHVKVGQKMLPEKFLWFYFLHN